MDGIAEFAKNHPVSFQLILEHAARKEPEKAALLMCNTLIDRNLVPGVAVEAECLASFRGEMYPLCLELIALLSGAQDRLALGEQLLRHYPDLLE